MWWLGLGGLLLGAGLLALGLWHWAEGEAAYEHALECEEACRRERRWLRTMVISGMAPGTEAGEYVRVTRELREFLYSSEPASAATVRDYDGGVR